MSMRDYAVDDYGLILTGKTLQFIAGKISDDYTESKWYEDEYDFIFEIVDKLGAQYISEFTGEALRIDDDGDIDWRGAESYSGDIVVYFPISRYPTLFEAAYGGMDEMISEFRDRYGEYLPSGYDYRENVRHLTGTYYG